MLAFKSGQSEAAGGTFVTQGFTPTIQGGSNGSTQVPAVLASGQANAEVGSGIWPSLTLLHEAPIAFVGRPRRLTPLECERLMSWPDRWTATGVDEAGREYALSDTARYRLCGNGVGSVCVAWIAKRLSAAIQEQRGGQGC